MRLSSKNLDRGFTLIELLISVAVFSVVIMISLGAVVSILDSGRKARALTAVMTNINFTLEVLSREMKSGTNFYCGIDTAVPHSSTRNCTGSSNPPENSITFTTSLGDSVIYRLNNNQIEKSVNGGGYIGVTSPEILVEMLEFYVIGSTAGDSLQPRVFMRTRGYAGTKPSIQSRFFIQTVLSGRILDV